MERRVRETRTHGVKRGKRWKAVLAHRSDLTYRYLYIFYPKSNIHH